jgi:hypothetical protein
METCLHLLTVQTMRSDLQVRHYFLDLVTDS